MNRRLITIIASWAFFVCAVPGITSAGSLQEFLNPVDASQQKKALQRISSEKERYSEEIKDLLESYFSEQKIDRNLNHILYLTAVLKDPNHQDILLKMLVDDNYLVDQCIYNCPIVLTLTVHALKTDWKPPSELKPDNTKISDLISNIQYWLDAALEKEHAYEHISGEKVEKLLREVSTMSEKELIKMAGADNSDSWKKLFAAYELSYSVTTSENLMDLYMLVINETPPDGASEYRNSIYTAILRAETAKTRIITSSPH